VLRCYDDRFQATERKPDFYLDFDPDGEKIGEIVFRVSNPSPLETSAVGSASDENDRAMRVKYSWMWKVSRQVLVIRTPYWPGRHVAADPSEFLPIIDFLQYMHEKGFVHGDIRCFNIVFNGDKGKLIDFDYSGRAEVTKYPQKYQFSLPDGTRKSREDTRKRKEIGSEERDAYDAVPKWHDWYALGHAILTFHAIDADSEDEVDDDHICLLESRARRELRKMKSDADATHFVATLVDFLKACSNAGWVCTQLKCQTSTRC
jgi:serine/threonine protein kinase